MNLLKLLSAGFERHHLGNSHAFYVGELPENLCFDSAAFEWLWQMHPLEYHKIKMRGRLISSRWQQTYGMDYTGRINKALAVPSLLQPLLAWARENIDGRLNGILVNWYDGLSRHYIGRHRDSIKNLIEGVPIVTISFGEERVFRLRPFHGTGHEDFPTSDGSVFLMPYQTNMAWTHEVPHARRYTGRRISVTLRGFVQS